MDNAKTPEITDADILAGAMAAAHRTDKPPVPEPPTWEVYATPGNNPVALRVMHKGVTLSNVTDASLDVGPDGAILHLSIELPADAFVQLKGSRYNWLAARQAKEARGE